MYLLDSNIFLEILLEHEKAGDAEKLLRSIPSELLYISEFSPYSVGIVLIHRKKFDILKISS